MISLFEQILPTPNYLPGTTIASFAGLAWESQADRAIAFRSHLKVALRDDQKGQCAYCRRFLGDISDTHLEHFVEKAAFPGLAFAILNLALSCSTCNRQKNSRYLRLSFRMSRIASQKAGVKVSLNCCPSLAQQGLFNLNDAAAYRWVHPHLHVYGDHITIKKGMIFVGTTGNGRRTVTGLQFNKLAALEQRMIMERLAVRKGALSYGLSTLMAYNDGAPVNLTAVATEILKRIAALKLL